MISTPCKALRSQGYQFFSPDSSAAVKPCLWCKKALKGGDTCYKHQFYGIASHRCVQMTPTLRCNHRCLFCWRSFEHEYPGERECTPEEILAGIPALQKRALSGYKVSPYVTAERFSEALAPAHVAISLSGEPTLYSHLPELIGLLNEEGYTTFLVTNGTNPDVLSRCDPFQTYVSLPAPDRETYLRICRPRDDYWDRIRESLALLGSRRSAVRVTLVRGLNDYAPERYAALLQESGATYGELKGYMYLGYSRKRLSREHMPTHEYIREFAGAISELCDYRIADENRASRVVQLERMQ
ncbi:MAG TPA: 4-demethylwyosine synthase TYW1 [Methanoregulaceae archaeon]|jgi:tRNA wybutosine-synthesizing protein 1|nr:4-demethylwyosine synthase TYW1 [Methanoregulaceae archaeon]